MAFKYNPTDHTIRKLKPGKQGMVGTITDASAGTTRAYKFSSLLNMNGTHEYAVINSLMPLRYVCPYFPTECELVRHTVDSDYAESDNPFDTCSKHKIVCDMCISEYVGSSRKLTAFIEHPEVVDESIVVSLMKQALVGVLMARAYNGFTHYDLHSENILVQKCPYDDVYVWLDTSGKTPVPYVIPSLGYIPRIIDYGFSYSDAVQGGPHMAPLDFMKEGYTSYRSDRFADFRILLTSTMDDMYHYRRHDSMFGIQRSIVKKLFKRTCIDWGSGWLKDVKACAVKYLYEMCCSCKYKDGLFASPTINEHFYAILDLLQLMIPVPIQTDPFKDKPEMADVFAEFLIGMREFAKHFYRLEGLVEANTRDEHCYDPNPTMGLYIVRASIDSVIKTQGRYTSPGKSGDAVRAFKNMLYDEIRRSGVIHNLPKINYEKYMVSFQVMANALQSLLYREIQYREWYIEKEYAKIPVDDSHDIFYILNHHLHIPYEYVPGKTRIIFMDDTNRDDMCAKMYTLDGAECDALNAIDNPADIHERVYALISKKPPCRVIGNTGTISVLDAVTRDPGLDTVSPTQTVRMHEWEDTDESGSESSDDDDFAVKYDWKHDGDTSSKEPRRHYEVSDYVVDSD